MAALPAFFILLILLNITHGYQLMDDEADTTNEIIWPSEYHFKGEKLNFITTNKEVFEIWYNLAVNRSRIDFFGGIDSNYYYADTGRIFSLVPVTTEEKLNEKVCYVHRSRSEVEDQKDFLPVVSKYMYTGKTDKMFDITVDIWNYRTNGITKITEQTLYVYRTDEGYDVPVQHIKKVYNTRHGYLDIHLVTNYYDFEANATEEVLTCPFEEYNCEDMGKLGLNWQSAQKALHPDVPGDLDVAFDSFQKHHKKDYNKHEKLTRKEIFERNWRTVTEHNRQNLGYKLEMNSFSDKTPEELKYLRGTFPSHQDVPELQTFPHSQLEVDHLIRELPENFDLRMEGVVGPVKNQGNCGSCWAFTTTSMVETAVIRSLGGRLLDLSEQSLVDCAWGFQNYGCNGGELRGALKYVMEHGIPTEEEYGVYKENNGYCSIANMTTTYKIRSLVRVTPQSANSLKLAVYKYGAVGVSIHASVAMALYSSGIFYDKECEDKGPNHGVVVVGYGVRDGQEYWLVRNSWGQEWGQGGYILMSTKNNNCLVMDDPYYPIV